MPEPRFENYPVGEAARSATEELAEPAPAWEQQPPAAQWPHTVAPYRAPTADSPPSGPSRRRVLGWALPGVAVAVGLSMVLRSEDFDDSGAEHDPPVESLGQFEVAVPDGWTADRRSDTEIVLARGKNRLHAYTFAAGSGDDAADLIKPLVRRRMGRFAGRTGKPFAEPATDFDYASLTANGKLGDRAARLKGELWIGLDQVALLVVQVLTATAGTAADAEAADMRDQLSGSFDA